MELAHRWINRDLTKLELIISLVVLSIFIGTFSRYMLIVFSKVEKTMIERTVVNINTAISYHAAFSVIKGDTAYFDQIVNMNPMDLMTDGFSLANQIYNTQDIDAIGVNYYLTPPSNYGGEVIDDTDPSLKPGKWYFDQDDNFLFYKLSNSEYFISNLEGPSRVRYKSKISYIDQDIDGEFNSSVDKFLSLNMEPMDLFEWTF